MLDELLEGLELLVHQPLKELLFLGTVFQEEEFSQLGGSRRVIGIDEAGQLDAHEVSGGLDALDVHFGEDVLELLALRLIAQLAIRTLPQVLVLLLQEVVSVAVELRDKILACLIDYGDEVDRRRCSVLMMTWQVGLGQTELRPSHGLLVSKGPLCVVEDWVHDHRVLRHASVVLEEGVRGQHTWPSSRVYLTAVAKTRRLRSRNWRWDRCEMLCCMIFLEGTALLRREICHGLFRKATLQRHLLAEGVLRGSGEVRALTARVSQLVLDCLGELVRRRASHVLLIIIHGLLVHKEYKLTVVVGWS